MALGFRLWRAGLLATVLLAPTLVSGPAAAKDGFGPQAFPPEPIGTEANVTDLARLVNGSLALGLLIHPDWKPRMEERHVSYYDPYRLSLDLPVTRYVYRGPDETEMNLYYTNDTGEFLFLRIRYGHPGSPPSGTVREWGERAAAALGVPLDRSLFEVEEFRYSQGPNPNGTGELYRTTVRATWREEVSGVGISRANQMHVVMNNDTNRITWFVLHRWFSGPPVSAPGEAEVLAAAESFVEANGYRGTVRLNGHALAPNYQEGNWSVLAEFSYIPTSGDSQAITFTVLFNRTSLQPERVVDERYPPSPYTPDAPPGLGLTVAAGVGAAVLLVLAVLAVPRLEDRRRRDRPR